jgi:glycogen debranching enzyme
MLASTSAVSLYMEADSAVQGPTVTLSAGSSFVIVGVDGRIRPGGHEGYYVDDTRLVSAWNIYIDGSAIRPLQNSSTDRHLCVHGTIGDPTTPRLLVGQNVRLDTDLVVSLSIENLTADTQQVIVDLSIASDFADLFEVKRGARPRGGLVTSGPIDRDLVVRYQSGGFQRGLRVRVDHDDPNATTEVMRDGIHHFAEIGGRQTTDVRFVVTPRRDRRRVATTEIDPRARWRSIPDQPAPAMISDRIWRQSWRDLAALVLADPLRPTRTIVAAGAPWFMALFGRDSLVTALETLPYRTDLAVDVLGALADRQGRANDPTTLEEVGRIPHEARRGEAVQRPGGWGSTFYGTVDATPLFVITLATAWRAGADRATIEALLPAAERAVAWIETRRATTGFVTYPGHAHAAAGLANEGWKDSDDSIRHPDGSLAGGPIALVEVQGYCHAALMSIAQLRDNFGSGDADNAARRADELRDHIDEAFWMPDDDCYAMALDGDGQQVSSVSSNAGHLLLTGTATDDRARRLSARLMADDMFTGFGIRTLSTSNRGYNPLSYHCGSVWPHDTALIAAGMLRLGLSDGHQLALALLDAADESGRFPELFGGFARADHPTPIPYPASCRPQAWAAGAPLLLADGLARVGAVTDS